MINKIKEKFQSEEKKRLLSNFFSLAVLQGANYILPLFTFPYLIRVLGIEYFGLLAFANSVIIYFNIIINYGFHLNATREVSIYREDEEKLLDIFNSFMIIKLFFLLISLSILFFLILYIDKFREHYDVFIYTFGVVIGQYLFPKWFFQGIEEMKYITYLNVIAKIIFTILILIFVQDKGDFVLVPIFTSMGFIFVGIISLIIIKKKFNMYFKRQNIKTLIFYLKDSWSMWLSYLVGNFYKNFNIIALGFFTTNTVVGYYSIAETIIKIVQSLQDVVGDTLFPYLSKKFSKSKKQFFEITSKYIRLILVIYLLLVILIFLFAPYIVYILKGSYQFNIIINIKIMSFIILVGGLGYYFGILGLVSLNYKKEFSNYVIITGIINIFISSFLIYFYKDIGASVSWLLSELILLYLILFKIYKIKKGINK